jgi:hypothetical protein
MLTVQQKAEVDEALIDFNECLRQLRGMAEGRTPLDGFQHTLCDLLGCVNERKLKPSKAFRRYAKLVAAFAELAAECEERNAVAGSECDCGVYAFNVAVAPVTIVLNAVHCGFEIARGKDMQP